MQIIYKKVNKKHTVQAIEKEAKAHRKEASEKKRKFRRQ
jgi:ribosomal protein L44E